MSIEINNKNDLINILDNEQLIIFKVKYSNRKNPFENYEDLIQSYKIDFFELAIKALLENQSFWQVGNILIYLIPYSELDASKIMHFYRLSYEQEKGTSHYFRISKKISEVNKEISKELLSLLQKEEKQYAISVVAAIQVTLHNKYRISQFDNILNAIKDGNIFKIKSGISYIHQYNFSEKEYKLIFEELKKIPAKQNKDLDRELIYTVSDMLVKEYEYFSQLLLLYIGQDIGIDLKYDISRVLTISNKKYFQSEWYKKVFMSFVYVGYSTNIVNNIEEILIHYLKNKEYEFIENFVNEWVNNSNIYQYEVISFFEEFSHDDYFSKFITKSLNSDNYKIHLFISKNLATEVRLDRVILESFDFDDLLYICRKILGYLDEFNMQMSMIFSILSIENISKKIQILISEIIVNYVGENYASNTIEYLKNLDNKSLSLVEKEVKKEVLQKLEERNKIWKELPRLKELMPPSQQNKIIQKAHSIAMSKAIKESEKGSFMSMLFTKIPIGQGKGWFSEREGNFTQVAYMQSYSHSIVVPSATRTHPVHYGLERYQFKLAKRGEK